MKFFEYSIKQLFSDVFPQKKRIWDKFTSFHLECTQLTFNIEIISQMLFAHCWDFLNFSSTLFNFLWFFFIHNTLYTEGLKWQFSILIKYFHFSLSKFLSFLLTSARNETKKFIFFSKLSGLHSPTLSSFYYLISKKRRDPHNEFHVMTSEKNN